MSRLTAASRPPLARHCRPVSEESGGWVTQGKTTPLPHVSHCASNAPRGGGRWRWQTASSRQAREGHVTPEAQEGGPIALVRDGDTVRIDAETRSMDILGVCPEELAARRAAWVAPPLKASQGTLYKYRKCVSSASLGCVTDM